MERRRQSVRQKLLPTRCTRRRNRSHARGRRQGLPSQAQRAQIVKAHRRSRRLDASKLTRAAVSILNASSIRKITSYSSNKTFLCQNIVLAKAGEEPLDPNDPDVFNQMASDNRLNAFWNGPTKFTEKKLAAAVREFIAKREVIGYIATDLREAKRRNYRPYQRRTKAGPT